MDFFELNKSVRITTASPIDGDRYIVANITERDALIPDRAFNGLQVYVTGDKVLYILEDDTINYWVEVGSQTGIESDFTQIIFNSGGTLTGSSNLTYDYNTEKIRFNNAYSFPTNSGSSGNILTQSADSSLYWQESANSLAGLTDTIITTPQLNDILVYSGTEWINSGVTEDILIGGSGITINTAIPGLVIVENDKYVTDFSINGAGDTITLTLKDSTSFDVTVTGGGGGTGAGYYLTGASFSVSSNTESIISYELCGTTQEVDLDIHNKLYLNNLAGVDVLTTSSEDFLVYDNLSGDWVSSGINYVHSDGDTMTGPLIITVPPGHSGLTVNGDSIFIGDVYISGTTITQDVENMAVTNNMIIINSGQTGDYGVTNKTAGIIIDRGNLSAYTFIFDEDSNAFRIGITTSSVSANRIETGSTQKIATREEDPINNSIAFWNGDKHRFDTIVPGPSTSETEIPVVSAGTWKYTDVGDLITGVDSWSTIAGDTSTSATTSNANQTLSVLGGDLINTVADSSTITINHSEIGEIDDTFTSNMIINSFSVDEVGHITGVTRTAIDFSDFYTSAQTAQNFLSANTSISMGPDMSVQFVSGATLSGTNALEYNYNDGFLTIPNLKITDIIIPAFCGDVANLVLRNNVVLAEPLANFDLNDILNVSAATPSNNDILIYDYTQDMWVNTGSVDGYDQLSAGTGITISEEPGFVVISTSPEAHFDDVVISSGGSYYIGDPEDYNTWRININSSGNLVMEKNVSGTWTVGQTVSV